MVTAYDSESGRPGSNPKWGLICYKASITAQGLPNLHPSGVVPGFTRIYQDPSMKILSWMAIGRGKKHTLINTPSRSSSDDQASS